MPINIANKKCKNIYYSDNNKNVKEIAVVYDDNSIIYVKSFSAVTFTSSGTWTVPKGIKQVKIDCVGGQGQGTNGGKGGRVQCLLTTTPDSTLYITVGKQAASGLSAPVYNASDVRIGGNTYNNRVIVAGGGGNQANSGAIGGAGGGLTGGNGGYGYGGNSNGKGGTQSAGGGGGAGTPVSVGHYHNGGNGTFGLGGAGSYETQYEGPSGAGGAGWYGGGGGAGDWNKNGAFTAGGGGGSSYTNSSYCSSVTHTQGYRSGNGYVTISMAT